ncbi:MAG: helix-turn-helix domain-containing protein [Mycobacterium sp.]
MSTACSTGRHGDHDVYDADCPCRDLLDVLASKWAALVIGALEAGPLRFTELQHQMAGVSPKSLTKTLRRLQEYGLIDRLVYAEVPPRVDYTLTPTGKSAAVPLSALRQWAEQHLDSLEPA